MSSDTKKLIPILVIVGVLMCGCIAVPIVGAAAMFAFVGMRFEAEANQAMEQADFNKLDPTVFGEGLTPQMSLEPGQVVGDGGSSSDAKQAAYQEMLFAEQEYRTANALYEGAQAVYESQRNFNNSQAGRLGAQGISVPPAQAPDPSLYQNVLAAQQRYEAAKAAYEAIP